MALRKKLSRPVCVRPQESVKAVARRPVLTIRRLVKRINKEKSFVSSEFARDIEILTKLAGLAGHAVVGMSAALVERIIRDIELLHESDAARVLVALIDMCGKGTTKNDGVRRMVVWECPGCHKAGIVRRTVMTREDFIDISSTGCGTCRKNGSFPRYFSVLLERS